MSDDRRDEATLPAALDDARPGRSWCPAGRAGDLVAGRYRLEELTGTGGMGAVWRAVDVAEDRPVAVKEFAAGPELAWREARAASLVDHPGVVGVRDVALTDRPWLVMDLVDGHSLAEEIRAAGRLDLPTVLGVARELLLALAAVHRAGLVHRDVKPGNVLLDDERHVVLTDFGLAAAAGEPVAPGAGGLLGSPPYLAPEVLSGARSGTSCDLFAYGATLFTAVEGTRPFAGSSPESTVQALLTEEPAPMRHAGPLEPLISGLLRKDPRRRLSASQARAHLANIDPRPAAGIAA